jgi:membrane protein
MAEPAAEAAPTRTARIRATVTRLRSRHEWLDHLARASARYHEHHGNHFAAAVTFFTVLAAVPLLMIAFAAAGYVLFFNQSLLTELEAALASALPGALSDEIRPVIDAAIAQRNTVAGFGLLAALWTGTWWMMNLREAVAAQWGMRRVNATSLRRLVRDVVALAVLWAAVIGSLVIIVTGTRFSTALLRLAGLEATGAARVLLTASSVLLGLLANWLIFYWIIARLPRRRTAVHGAVRAALLGAVGYEILVMGTTVYLDVVSESRSGAAFGSMLGLLLFAYLVSRLVLFLTAWAATTRGNERPTLPAVPGPAVIQTVVAVQRPRAATVAGAIGAAMAAGVLLGRRASPSRNGRAH